MQPVKNQYKRTFNGEYSTILAGDTDSSIIDFGGMQCRCILLPSNWTDCTMTFKGAIVGPENLDYFQWDIRNYDGVDAPILTMPAYASGWVPLYAHWFDAVPYLQLVCSIAQSVDTTVILAAQPLYQGVHG